MDQNVDVVTAMKIVRDYLVALKGRMLREGERRDEWDATDAGGMTYVASRHRYGNRTDVSVS